MWKLTRGRLMVGILFLMATIPPIEADAGSFSVESIFVFGDSLSDGGNAAQITGGIEPPSPPYANRSSNGPTAVEYLAGLKGVMLTPSLFGGTNYAVSGAMTGPDPNGVDNFNYYRLPALGVPFPVAEQLLGTGVLAQIDTFVDAHVLFDPSTSLFVVWAFANDLFAWQFNQAGRTIDQVIAAGISNVVAAVSELSFAGAEHFLVPNLADLGLTPLATLMSQQSELTALSEVFNAALAPTLLALGAGLGVEITTFDIAGLLREITGNPAAFGFDTATAPCVDPVALTVCDLPDRFLFWDVVHPTTKGHAILGAFFAQAIPMPAPVWLIGIGLVALTAIRIGSTVRGRLPGVRPRLPLDAPLED